MPEFDIDAALLAPREEHRVFSTYHDAVGREWEYGKEALMLDDVNALNMIICDNTGYVIGQATNGTFFTMFGDQDFHGGTFDEAVQFLRTCADMEEDDMEGEAYRAHADEVGRM